MDILNEYLKYMVEKDASDIYLTAGIPPSFRIEGVVSAYGDKPLTPEDTENIAFSVMKDSQKKTFEEEMEMNLAIYVPEYGRFRVNIFRQKAFVGLVIRQIKLTIKTLDTYRAFDYLWIMTKGGPGTSSTTLNLATYKMTQET